MSGFWERWSKWIKDCVSTVSFSILINVGRRARLKGEKGFRQGNPLSSFLFNLVINVLGRLIDKAKAMNLIWGLHA